MRLVTRKTMITMAAAGGALALGGGYAHAGADANGGASNSPGVASGNSVQVPVHVPVNACGNTVNIVGLLNPAFGNECANVSGSTAPAAPTAPGGSHAGGQPGGAPSGAQSGGGAQANGGAANSPGVGSGNNVQAPVDVPVNACGNTIDVVGLLNPAFGNDCANDSAPVPVKPPVKPTEPPQPPTPGKPAPPEPSEPPTVRPPGGTDNHVRTPETPAHKANSSISKAAEQPEALDELARTGVDSLGLTIPIGAGMMLAGVVLYRRARARA
ncbi:chaplin [Streptomyces sp. NPDC001985]|uniref:chaplin n=1 Tax=Streptomyces sp. NPDC001985 TaxID=3154406 RepID=UPI00331984E5